MPVFVARYTYKTDEASLALKAETLPGHIEFIGELTESNSLLIAGPWSAEDPSGGLIVFLADDREKATATIASDPFVKADLLTNLDITQWRASLGPLAQHIPS